MRVADDCRQSFASRRMQRKLTFIQLNIYHILSEMAFIECLQCFSVQFLYTIEHIVPIIDCGRMTSAGRRIMMIDGACGHAYRSSLIYLLFYAHWI